MRLAERQIRLGMANRATPVYGINERSRARTARDGALITMVKTDIATLEQA